MKRSVLLLIGLAIGALLGGFFGYAVGQHSGASVFVRNLADVPLPNVSITTDVGESHSLAELCPHCETRVDVSGRPMALRVIAVTKEGKQLTSDEIYLTHGLAATANISSDAIKLDYKL